MDNFAEQLVRREKTPSDAMKKGVLCAFGSLFSVSLTVAAIFSRGILTTVFALSAVGAVIVVRMLAVRSDVEYEYSVTNGELDIDKIIAKKKRIHLASFDVRSFKAFGKYTDEVPDSEDITAVICSDNIAEHEYYADMTHKDFGNTRLIFAPNEKMLEVIKIYLPSKLKKELS